MSDFVGFLIHNDIRRVTSSTVKDEANGELVRTVNKFVDAVLERKRWQFRTAMIQRSKARLEALWDRLDLRSLHGDFAAVKKFYDDLSKNPVTKVKLEELRQLKRRRTLVPEDSDMMILSEAVTLKTGDEAPYFVTKDRDFTEFSNKIEEKFALKVLPVQDIIQFRIKLENQLRQK